MPEIFQTGIKFYSLGDLGIQLTQESSDFFESLIALKYEEQELTNKMQQYDTQAKELLNFYLRGDNMKKLDILFAQKDPEKYLSLRAQVDETTRRLQELQQSQKFPYNVHCI